MYPKNIRRAARKFLSAQGASPQQCGWTLLYAFYAWNLSDASIGNEKGYSVFLPSEYQARRPKVPFRSRRVAPTVRVNTSVRVLCLKSIWRFDRQWERLQRVFTLRISGTLPESSFPLKARRPNSAGEHFCTRFMLEIYLTLRSAMRKVTACFYPQNIRRAARKFLSAQGASPQQCGWTLLYAFYAWNLSDASIGNEKGYSVFLP